MSTHSNDMTLESSTLSIAILFAILSPLAGAASFTVANGDTLTGVQFLSNNETATIEVGGTLDKGGDGLSIGAVNQLDIIINNNGTILGLINAESGTNATITNSGIITGSIVATHSDKATITNSGTINGNVAADITTNATIINSGTINGVIVARFAPNTTITNSGTINSNVFLSNSSGINKLNLAGGTITGNVFGDANTRVHITGAVAVANYSAVNFNAIGSFDVTSGGTFSFANGTIFDMTGKVNGLPLVNSGVVNVAAGTATLTGNYTQAANGVFRTQVTDDTTYGKLIVSGIATLASNAKIDVNVADAHFNFTTALTNGMADIISAGTLTSDGTFSVTDNSVLVDFSAVKNGDTVDLVLTAAANGTGVLAAVKSVGLRSGEGAATVFDDLINNGGGSAAMDAALNNLVSNHSATQQAVADAVESTLPSLSGGVAQATNLIGHAVTDLVRARQDTRRGLSSGDGFMTDRHLWLKPFGSWTEQDDRRGVTGYDIDSYGLALGLDGKLSSTWELGFALAYINSDVGSKLNVGRQTIDIDSYLAKVYASKTLDDSTTLKLQVGVGMSDYDSRRGLFNGDIAEANYDSWQLQASAALERRFVISDKTALTPYMHADYSYVDVESYNESGAGALNLAVKSDSADSLIIGLGMKIDHIATENITLMADAGLGYDVMTDRSSLTSSFAGGGAQFTTQGITPDEFVYHMGLGAQYQLDNGTQIAAHYDIEGREDYTDESVNVTMRWLF